MFKNTLIGADPGGGYLGKTQVGSVVTPIGLASVGVPLAHLTTA